MDGMDRTENPITDSIIKDTYQAFVNGNEVTTANKIPPYDEEKSALLAHEFLNVLQAVVLVICLYVFVVLIDYERSLGNASLASLIKGTVRVAAARSAAKFGKWLRRLCILGAGFCLASSCNDLIYYNVKLGSDAACTIMQVVGVSLLTNLDTTVYIFLWLRQYVVYQSLSFHHPVINVILAIIKYIVLFFIIGLCLLMNGLLIIYRRHYYNETSGMCGKAKSPIDDIFTNLWASGSVTLQFILVVLFVVPLVRHSAKYGKRKGETTIVNSQNPFVDTRTRLMSLIRRCLVISGLCVATDILVMILTERILLESKYRQLRPLFYNINILFNLILVITSFKEWKDMLLLSRRQLYIRNLLKTRRRQQSRSVVETQADIQLHSLSQNLPGSPLKERTCST